MSTGTYSHWGQHESLLCQLVHTVTEDSMKVYCGENIAQNVLTEQKHGRDIEHGRRIMHTTIVTMHGGSNLTITSQATTMQWAVACLQNYSNQAWNKTHRTDSNCCWVELGAVNQELVQIQYVECQEICAETAIKSYAADRQARSYGYYTLSQDTILLSTTLPNAKRFLKIFHC